MRSTLLLPSTLLLATLATGCSSITGSDMQSLSLTAVGTDGKPIDKAECVLDNDKGHWTATTPGFVMVRRSAEDLTVTCKKPEMSDGVLKAVSRAAGSMFGNIIFGGGVGALIDHSNGKGYNYPDLLPVQMGMSVIVDRRVQDAQTQAQSGNTPTPPGQTAMPVIAANPAPPAR